MANLQRELNQPPSSSSYTLNDQSLPNGGGTLNDLNNTMASNNIMRTSSSNNSATMEAIDLIHHTNDNNTVTVPIDLSSANNNKNKRRAKCLNNYQAQSDDELSLLADEIIFVSLIDHKNESINDASDWMYGERLSDGKKGKVPVAYLEILN